MAYKVINKFRDKEDKNTLYNVGDSYPKGSYKPAKKRVSELSKVHPKYNLVFIEEVKEKVVEKQQKE